MDKFFSFELLHTISVQYPTAGSRRLKKHGSLTTGVRSNLIHSRVSGTEDGLGAAVANEISIEQQKLGGLRTSR